MIGREFSSTTSQIPLNSRRRAQMKSGHHFTAICNVRYTLALDHDYESNFKTMNVL